MSSEGNFTSLLNRVRRRAPVTPWKELDQPVPLIRFTAHSTPNSSSVRYIANGITPEAEQILSQLPVPIYVVAFAGFGRSGKSFTASRIRKVVTENDLHNFTSMPGNIPCTHGIDMMVFEHPKEGHILFLDCEGGANHNQSAIPFVMGLAARLASRMYVFERGCFTTGGLETVMQVINMGHATTSSDTVDITKSIVLCENMTINNGISPSKLLNDLLAEESGDEMTNKVRQLVKENFDIELIKLPYVNHQGVSEEHDQACEELAYKMVNELEPLKVGGVYVDGVVICQLVNELLSQIRGGGNRFNMVTATEALVQNMAAEASNTVWIEFVDKIRKSGNHPVQINGRKHLRTVMREVEGIANQSVTALEAFTAKLQPAESAIVAKESWDRNYHNFTADIRAAHARKSEELAKYARFGEKMNKLISSIVAHIIEAIRQAIRFARFSSTLILMGNYYLWKQSLGLVSSVASGVMTKS